MNFLSYDIEIYEDLIDDQPVDLTKITPSVAAVCTNEDDVQFFYDEPFMTKKTAQTLVEIISDYYDNGYIPFTWNGLSFDFPLLGYYSGMIDQCAHLAFNSVDAMFMVVANKGHNLGLDTALIGAGLETKTHHVKLNSGEEILDMSGAKAPTFWRNGEFEAVKTYLRGDVIQPLKLTFAIEKNHGIKWTSKTGRSQFLSTNLITVKDCLKIREPDTSWMTNPKSRSEYYSWIPKNILDKEL